MTWSVEPGLEIVGDRELVAQAVTNLLENAQRHTATGTVIELSLARTDRGARIVVADNGPGVAAEHRASITKRFIRLEHSRSQAGHGLGLNLVSAIVELHRGTLEFSDHRPGLVTQITLPLDAG